jgi:hypothetical protein
LSLQLPSTIAAAISVVLPSAIAIAIAVTVAVAVAVAIAVAFAIAVTLTLTLAVGHCHLHHCRPLQLLSPSAITVTDAVGHFQKLLPWCGENRIQPIEAKNAYLIFFCLDIWWHID